MVKEVSVVLGINQLELPEDQSDQNKGLSIQHTWHCLVPIYNFFLQIGPLHLLKLQMWWWSFDEQTESKKDMSCIDQL